MRDAFIPVTHKARGLDVCLWTCIWKEKGLPAREILTKLMSLFKLVHKGTGIV